METSNVLSQPAPFNGRMLPPPAPWSQPDTTLGLPPTRPQTTDEVPWLVHTSNHRGTTLQLTDTLIRHGEAQIQLGQIEDVAFSSPKRHRHSVSLSGPGTSMQIALASNGFRRIDPTRRAYIEIVRLLETRAFPRLIQNRLQRLSTDAVVQIGKLELRRTGLEFASAGRRRRADWVDFDHVVLTGQRLVIMVRTNRGRHRAFGEVALHEMNAVLLPALLPAAAFTFRSSPTT
jgi:hypothetical protein